jgi:CRISPR/Cas system-associated protein endoribonuclease Cas2
VRNHFSDHAPNRNPAEASFRCVDRRITEAQFEMMNHLDNWYGIDNYYVNSDGTVEVTIIDGFTSIIQRDSSEIRN